MRITSAPETSLEVVFARAVALNVSGAPAC
jgi:hypothetical protein